MRLRSTFVALRATRLGHRIASEIRNPPLASSIPQQPVRDPDEVMITSEHPDPQYRITPISPAAKRTIDPDELRSNIFVFGALGFFFAFLFFMWCMSSGSH